MNLSVPSIRVDALPLLTVSVVILGLVVLPPFPAYAAEERLVGDVVVGHRGVEHDVSTGPVTPKYTDWWTTCIPGLGTSS